MSIWFFDRPNRLSHERAALDELASSVKWLRGHDWHLTGAMCVDAVIEAHGVEYTVRVAYPDLFPDAPIIVRPLNQTERLSTHQYGGPDGALCLEWGPDNWHSGVTAAQMLESTYRLLDAENPQGDHAEAPPRAVPSRHRLTIGQEVRGTWVRWLANGGLLTTLADYSSRSNAGPFQFSARNLGKSWAALIHEIGEWSGSTWEDPSIPTDLPGATKDCWYPGAWIKTTSPAPEILEATSLGQLEGLLLESGGPELLKRDRSSPIPGFDQSVRGLLIGDNSGVWHFFVNVKDDSLSWAAPIVDSPTAPRTPTDLRARLAGAKLAIIGLGSVGSKVATSLVRSGAKQLYLVDHDVLLPENVERHALDWRAVTGHKAAVVARACSFIDPLARVDVDMIHLSGQESNAAINRVLASLSECDLLVDATAEPQAFNLLAAVSQRARKPLAWAEVYAGGVGGLIARSRPGIDPSALAMRLAYLKYCEDHPPPPELIEAVRYDEHTARGVVTASDADVSILAHHLVRLAVDCLRPAEESAFPYSLYLVGLSKAWVFEAPFMTIPIDTVGIGEATPDTGETGGMSADTLQFLEGLLKKAKK